MPRPSHPLPKLVLRILERQDGIIAREQAIAAGMPLPQIEGHLKYRRWVRVAPRVYLQAPSPPTPHQVIRAVHLWAGPHSVITGAAALYWQGQRRDPPRIVEVAVEDHRRPPLLPGLPTPIRIVSHRRAIREEFKLRWSEIWTVRTEHAVYDLLPVEGPELLDDAIRQRWLTLAMVLEVQRLSPRWRGDGVRAGILAAAAGGAISEGERLLHRLLHAAGIGGWQANRAINLKNDTKVGDVVFDKIRLVLEVDGFAFHSAHERFQDDRSRQNLLVRSDWTVLRLTWWQLTNDPQGVVSEIRETIAMLERRLRGSQK